MHPPAIFGDFDRFVRKRDMREGAGRVLLHRNVSRKYGGVLAVPIPVFSLNAQLGSALDVPDPLD